LTVLRPRLPRSASWCRIISIPASASMTDPVGVEFSDGPVFVCVGIAHSISRKVKAINIRVATCETWSWVWSPSRQRRRCSSARESPKRVDSRVGLCGHRPASGNIPHSFSRRATRRLP
jgi:hypothetical protein